MSLSFINMRKKFKQILIGQELHCISNPQAMKLTVSNLHNLIDRISIPKHNLISRSKIQKSLFRK